MKCTSIVLLALLTLSSARVTYDGYQVWRLDVEAKTQARLAEIVSEYSLDVWAENMEWMDVLIRPSQRSAIAQDLAMRGVHSRISIEDVQTLVENNYKEQERNTRATFDFTQYNLLEDIEAYLIGLPDQDDRTSIKSLGKTSEGRELWQLRISTGAGKQPVWIDCGIHAREWISPATCLWGINYLLTSYGTDQGVTDLLDAYDLWMLPVNNPDGYAYTQEDRFWRKNRMHYDGDTCTGVDLNRNFDEHFGGAGTSSNSCSETYKGPSAASELETRAVQVAIDEMAATAKSLYSIHSFSQLWMFAYGWTCDLPPDNTQLSKIADTGVAALTAVHGTTYRSGTICNAIYAAAGTTVDYSYTAGIVNSFTLELRDTGNYGFLLPADQIVPSGEETWAGLIAAILATP